MYDLRKIGLTHAYFDVKQEEFSNVALGLLARSIGHGLKVLYVNCGNDVNKVKTFFEDVAFLNSSADFLDLSKVLISDFVVDSSYELVIFDNVDFKKINLEHVFNFNKNRTENMEVVFVFKTLENFDILKQNFDLVSIYDYKEENQLIKSSILNITGNGKGKSTYAFGYLIRQLLNKNEVNLVYFDKGGDFYGEKFFFKRLKSQLYNQHKYGRFDFFVSGIERFDGTTFRFKNVEKDLSDAVRGLDLLKNILKKENITIIADELNTTVMTYLLSVEQISDVIKGSKNKLLLSGRGSPKKIIEISSQVIEVIDSKHYMNDGYPVRKGIDY